MEKSNPRVWTKTMTSRSLLTIAVLVPSSLFSSVWSADRVSEKCSTFLPPAPSSSTDLDIQTLGFCACALSSPLEEKENAEKHWYAPATLPGRVILPKGSNAGIFEVISIGVPIQSIPLFRIPRSGDPLAPWRLSYGFEDSQTFQLTPILASGDRITKRESTIRPQPPLGPPTNLRIDDSLKIELGATLKSLLKYAESSDGPRLFDDIYPVPPGNHEELRLSLKNAELQSAQAKDHTESLVDSLKSSLETISTDAISYSLRPIENGKESGFEIIEEVNGARSRATSLESQYQERLKAIRQAQENASVQQKQVFELKRRLSRLEKAMDLEKCRELGKNRRQKDWGGFFSALEEQIQVSSRASSLTQDKARSTGTKSGK